jgi:hypothetical protein
MDLCFECGFAFENKSKNNNNKNILLLFILR